jgi:biotin carboxylase
MNNVQLEGKKLLILSGGSYMCQIVQTAREYGVYTIVTDMYTDYSVSPAKLMADEAWDISWNDTDALAEKCRADGVDGVFTGFSEFCAVAARRLCDALGLPYYATMEQIDITRDKAKFKNLCIKNGVKTVDHYTGRSDVRFPVVVKPTDNAGSRGISVCYNEREFNAGIEKALSFSNSKSVVLEPFMDQPEVNISYTIQDGEISLSCMSDAQAGVQKHGQIKMTDGWLFPSRYLSHYVERCDENVKSMLKSIGINNGFLFITGFYDEPDFRIFEAGYRLGGGTTYNFIAYNNEINYMKMMIAHSLTGKMAGWDVREKDNPFFKKPCCNLTVMAKPGKVGHVGDIAGLRKMDGVLSVDQFYMLGQEIPDSGALSQTFARVNIVAESAEQLADRIEKTYELIDLRDEQGEDMILSRLQHDKIKHYWDECK